MSHYIATNGTASTISSTNSGNISISGNAEWSSPYIQYVVEKKKDSGISPVLYFKYIKKKFKILERVKIERRLSTIEEAFNEAVENGQNALGEKILRDLTIAMRESVMYAKGITKYIEREDLQKHKRNIQNGHISDTLLRNYTRIIPKDVIKKKKAVEDVFDDFVIYHYWNEEQDDVKNMSHTEKEKMRDPVLFGIIKENDRLYFIADWEDEYCTLTYQEIINVMGKDGKRSLKSKVEKI